MAKVSVYGQTRGPHERPNQPDKEGIKEHDGTPLGQYGHPEYVPIEISTKEFDSDNPRFFRLRASICEDEQSTFPFASAYSRCGFLLGTNDSPTGEDANATKYFYTSIHPEGEDTDYHSVEKCGFSADISRWIFGKAAELELKVEEKRDTNQHVRLIVRPFFPEDIDTIKMRLEIIALDRGECQINTWIHDVKFVKNQSARRSTPLNEWYKEVGAFNWTGDGSSVHPKQLHSSFALRDTITTHIRLNKKLNIAYIGPDTTENLRTVIRTLSEMQTATKFDVNLYVIFHEKWDVAKAINPFEHTPLCLSNTPDWLQLQGIGMADLIDEDNTLNTSKRFPKGDPELQKAFLKSPAVDIVLATYVTPWSIGYDEMSRINYQKVIEILMKEHTKLITVDPGRKEYCVVSQPPEGTNARKDMNEFYKTRLNLRGNPIIWNDDANDGDEQISTYMWERVSDGK